ncbi:MAG: imidazole glycerol phosphate synthase subunit HisH [Chloroflexota bacterium]|nr:imidazole glycerol phosphate synthase subunit HisH [Chloroflexota bacterium]
MIVIVDYGLGNLASVRNAFLAAGAEVAITADPAIVSRATGLVLPGVGAASAGMRQLRARNLEQPVLAAAQGGRPVLGLCLGMQLLFDGSEEGDTTCLGLLPGTVELLQGAMKVPHIGWNQVTRQGPSLLWDDLPHDPYFYFVHSYICRPRDPAMIAGTTDYGGPFCSVVAAGTIWGTQFHPERSGRIGQQLIRNFVSAVGAPVLGQPSR